MFEQKLNNQQNKSKNVIHKAYVVISNSQIYKYRKDLMKIVFSALNVCANILLMTKIRFPQLGNICTSSNYDPQYGCNSVFKNLVQQGSFRTSWQDNESASPNLELDSSQILNFAENQVQTDSNSILNIMRIAAPLYLIIFLCSNIAELANKKSKIDILVFILVLITVSDLLLFNTAYSFSNIKPNRQDSQLFNQHFVQHNQLSLRTYDQSILQQAQSDIFLQVNKFIIAFSIIVRAAAIMITVFKFSNNIQSLYSIKLICKKIQQIRKSSLRTQSQSNGNNSQSVSSLKNNINNLQNNHIQKSSGSSNPQNSKNNKNKSVSKLQLNPTTRRASLIENVENSFLGSTQQGQLEQIKDQSQTINMSTSSHLTNSNKKSKNMNKKQKKNQTKSNLKSAIQNIITSEDDVAMQIEQIQEEEDNTQENDSNTPFQESENNKMSNQNENIIENKENLSKNSEEGDDVNSQEQKSNSSQNLNSDVPDLQLQPKLFTSDSTYVKNQKFLKIQKSNFQISQDSDENQGLIQKIPKNSEVFDKPLGLNDSTKNHSCSLKSSELASPLLNSDHKAINFATNNNTLQMPSPQTILSGKQSSFETSDFSLNESTQIPLDPATPNSFNNLCNFQITPQLINPSTAPRIIIQNYQPEFESNNDQKRQNFQGSYGEQIVIEQVNEELRKKWMLKQKAMKLEKKKMNQSVNNLQANNIDNNNQSNTCINSSQFSSVDNNTSYIQGGSSYIQNNHFLSHDQQILQEDLDISTNDESNFTSINSNYDASAMTKQNYNPMNLKNFSQHLQNQQVATALSQQQQQQQLYEQLIQKNLQQQKTDLSMSHNDTCDLHQDVSSYYQEYQNQQYQEEQCYNEDNISRTTTLRTSKQSNLQASQNQFFEDNYQDPSQKCFEEFLRLNQNNNQNLLRQQNGKSNFIQNCPQKQQNQAFGFDYDDEECDKIEGKTPFEIFYDQQCMMDEDYDEEEELDQFQENMEDDDDEDEDDDEDDEEDDDDEDEDEDDNEERHSQSKNYWKLLKQTQGKSQQELFDMGYTQDQVKYIYQLNINNNNNNNNNGCNLNQEGTEQGSDNSAFLHSHLQQTTEICSVDELKSHLGDYLDMINDNSLIHQNNQDISLKKLDLSQFTPFQYYNQNDFEAGEDGKKKKKKKKKSKEQKRKRRCKRKLKKKLERSMCEQDLQGPIMLENSTTNSNYSQQECILNTQQTNFGNKKKNQRYKKNNSNNNNNRSKHGLGKDCQINVQEMYTDQTPNSYLNYSACSLKRLLDENLLEYFTFTVILSQGLSVNIYITDFYQFDEQFEMQSCIYGIDSSTILDAKLNLIFEIFSQNIYPNMTPFFEHLISTYSTAKLASLISLHNLEQQFTQQNCEKTESFFEENLTPSIALNEYDIDNNLYNNQAILIS